MSTLLTLLNKIYFRIRYFLLKFNFSSQNYWELRYLTNGNSGTGSYNEFAEFKSDFINQIIQDYKIDSIIEFGCGDGNQLQFYKIKKYLGLDVSDNAIKRCIHLYQDDPSKAFLSYRQDHFHHLDLFLKADAAISIEVLFHLVENPVWEKYLHDLFSCATKYVIIMSTNHDRNETASKHVFNRNFYSFIEKNYPHFEFEKSFVSNNKDVNERFYGDYFHLFKNKKASLIKKVGA